MRALSQSLWAMQRQCRQSEMVGDFAETNAERTLIDTDTDARAS